MQAMGTWHLTPMPGRGPASPVLVRLRMPEAATMTPEELAARHPRLYHVTTPGAVSEIMKHGLLPTSALLDLFEIVGEQRVAIVGRPREAEVLLEHATHGKAVISDNSPLTAK